MRRHFAVVPIVLLAAVRAPTQEPVSVDDHLRAKVLGEVVNKSGEPWAGAEVTLVALALGSIARPGLIDVVEATTDGRGRFTVALQRHRRYSAYAIAKLAGKGDDNGDQYRVSEFAEGVMSGGRVRLQEQRTVPGARSIRFVGLEKFRRHKPLRAFLVLGAENHQRIDLPMDAEHRVTLPPLPVGDHTIQVVGQAGRPVLSVSAKIAYKRGTTDYTVRTRTLRIGVRDAKSGKGIAAAEILWPLADELVTMGKTDKDGIAEFKVAVSNLYEWQHYLAAAEGYCTDGVMPRFIFMAMGGRKKEEPLREGVKLTATARLAKEIRYRGRIVFERGRPAKGLTLTLTGTGMGGSPMAVYTQTPRSCRTLRTDADGFYEIRGPSDVPNFFGAVAGAGQQGIAVVLTSAEVSRLPNSWRRQVRRVSDELVACVDGVAGKTEELPVIDLSELVPVMFEVTGARGLPVVGATVQISSALGFSFAYGADTGMRFVTDRGGRACVLMRSGVTRTVVVSKGAAIASQHLAVRGRRGDHSLVFARVELPPAVKVSGRVTNRKGKPVAGMTMTVLPDWENMVWAGGSTQEVQGEAPVFATPMGNAVALRELESQQRTRALMGLLNTVSMTGKTNKSGEFALEVPAHQKLVIHGQKRTLIFFSLAVKEKVAVEGRPIEGLKLEAK